MNAILVEEGGERGGNLEICFGARAPATSRFSVCALGLGHEWQHGAPPVFWVFVEPRLRIVGAPASGSARDAGVLLRLGIGGAARSNENPRMFAPGAYIMRRLDRRTDGTGWSIQAVYTHAWYGEFSNPNGFDPVTGAVLGSASASPRSGRPLVGLGWYQ
jgi:hypothetical protein